MTGCSDRALLIAVDNRGPISVPSLADLLDTHPVTVDLCCYELQADGYVSQTASGVYKITADGQTRLQKLNEL